MLIRRETAADVDAIRALTAAAFASKAPPGTVAPEAGLIDELRRSDGWRPEFSLVALGPADELVGHVLCTTGRVADTPVLALGPISVRPDLQRGGVGKALMHSALGAAEVLGEPMVILLGDPAYYSRYGFRLAAEYGITPSVAEWEPYFQVRTLSGYRPELRGAFRYAEPFYQV